MGQCVINILISKHLYNNYGNIFSKTLFKKIPIMSKNSPRIRTFRFSLFKQIVIKSYLLQSSIRFTFIEISKMLKKIIIYY